VHCRRHPPPASRYHFWDPKFKLANLGTANPQTGNGKHATVINEYGWLWLNRN